MESHMAPSGSEGHRTDSEAPKARGAAEIGASSLLKCLPFIFHRGTALSL